MKNFHRYKNNELSENELDNLTRELVRAKYRKDKKEKWAQLLEQQEDIKREKQNSKKTRRIFPRRYLLMIAASLVLLVIAFFVVQNNSQPKVLALAEAYISEKKFPNATETKGQTEKLLLQLRLAEAYNRDNFTEVIALGKELIDRNEARTEDYFFVGLSYLYTDDPKNAIRFFKQVSEQTNKEEQFAEESRWFLALAYIKAMDFENARTTLQNIIDQQSWNAEKATRLFETLDEIKTN